MNFNQTEDRVFTSAFLLWKNHVSSFWSELVDIMDTTSRGQIQDQILELDLKRFIFEIIILLHFKVAI